VVHSTSSGSSSGGGGGSNVGSAAAKPAHRHAAAPEAAASVSGSMRQAAGAAAAGERACLGQPLYHVSLSRTVPLRLDQIQPLIDELRRRLRYAAAAATAAAACAQPDCLLSPACSICGVCLPIVALIALAAGCHHSYKNVPLLLHVATAPFTTPTSPVGCAPCRQQDTFQIQLARLAVFCNDARTRTFLAVAAEEAGSSGSNTSSGSSSKGEHAAGGLAGGDSYAPAHSAECPAGKGSSGSGSIDGTSSSSDELGGSGRGASTAAAAGEAGGIAARRSQRPNYCRQLVQMCHAVSGVFAAHGLPRFYADPQPHASSEWPCVGTPVAA